MVNWRRRLFPEGGLATVVRGRDVGFTGKARRVVINDPYRLPDFRVASTSHQRLEAARSWLLKLAKNGRRGADDLGDPAIEQAVDKALDRAASVTLIVAADLKRTLAKLTDIADPEDRASSEQAPRHTAPWPTTRIMALMQQPDEEPGWIADPDSDRPWSALPRLRLASADDAEPDTG
jgi:hypothetical protein